MLSNLKPHSRYTQNWARYTQDRATHTKNRAWARLLVVLALGLPLAACAGKVTQHGHMLTNEEIRQVQSGMSKDQVRLTLGSPDTTSTLNAETYYYISSTRRGLAFLKPKVVGRRVVAVYFNKRENVKKVGYYGLKDGKIFDFISRTTPSHGSDTGLIKQILGNFGKVKKGF